jgi:hypothetical protein
MSSKPAGHVRFAGLEPEPTSSEDDHDITSGTDDDRKHAGKRARDYTTAEESDADATDTDNECFEELAGSVAGIILSVRAKVIISHCFHCNVHCLSDFVHIGDVNISSIMIGNLFDSPC